MYPQTGLREEKKTKSEVKLTSWGKGIYSVSSDKWWFEEHVFTVN